LRTVSPLSAFSTNIRGYGISKLKKLAYFAPNPPILVKIFFAGEIFHLGEKV